MDHEPMELEKRRGGGGGRGGSSSGGSSGGRSGSSSSSSSGSSSGSSGSSRGSTSSSSNSGGTTSKGSGVSPSYGGGRYDTPDTTSTHRGSWTGVWPGSGSSSKTKSVQRPKSDGRTYDANRYYAGGASTPYRAGALGALAVTPLLLPVAALAFWPGIWYHPVYAYDYNDDYQYHDDNTNKNTSLPVVCLCEEYQECGCSNNTNSSYYESLFNGTQPRNTSVVTVANVNGTEKIYINGTLANGTTAADSSAAPGAMGNLLHSSGHWVTIALVAAMVWSV